MIRAIKIYGIWYASEVHNFHDVADDIQTNLDIDPIVVIAQNIKALRKHLGPKAEIESC